MDVHEYIIASTIMEYDRERRKAKQAHKNNGQSQNANVGAGGLIAVVILWLILCIFICKIF